MKVSLIIPIGSKKTWPRCRRSIEASVAMCGSDVEFEVIPCFDLVRRGVSVARNEGLSRADGDWIAWVDCDDEVHERWAGRIVEEIGKGCDILAFGVRSVRNDGVSEIRPCSSPLEVPSDIFLKDCLRDLCGSTWLWNKVFKRSLFDGLRFEGGTQEDFRILPYVFSRAERVKAIPDVLYTYYRPSESLTHRGGGEVNAKGIIAAINDKLYGVGNSREIMAAWEEGCALRAADCIYHSGRIPELLSYLRKKLWRILINPRQSIRVKVKSVIAALGMKSRRD